MVWATRPPRIPNSDQGKFDDAKKDLEKKENKKRNSQETAFEAEKTAESINAKADATQDAIVGGVVGIVVVIVAPELLPAGGICCQFQQQQQNRLLTRMEMEMQTNSKTRATKPMPKMTKQLRQKLTTKKTTDQQSLPKVIPPLSVVRLKASSAVSPSGTRFRVGFYSKMDGLEVIWLVNSQGEYEQTWPRRGFEKAFFVESLSGEADFFGEHRAPLKPLSSK